MEMERWLGNCKEVNVCKERDANEDEEIRVFIKEREGFSRIAIRVRQNTGSLTR